MSYKPDIARYKYGYKDDGSGLRYLSLIADADGSVIKYADHEAASAADKARILELEEDKRRLDAMDSINAKLRLGWRAGLAPAGNISITSVVELGGNIRGIRQAIDAALAKQEQKP